MEKRYLINGKKYSLVGSRWFDHQGNLITDRVLINKLFGLTSWKNQRPIGADEEGGGGGISPVTSVNGKMGDVIITKGDLGLSNVDNTADINKPLSNPTKDYIDGIMSTEVQDRQTADNTLNQAIQTEKTAREDQDTILQTNIDEKVSKSGDTMTGSLILNGDPTSNLMAVPKQYIDNKISDLESNALTFKGFASTTEPTGDIRVGNYWYNGNSLPTTFPITVSEYNGTDWTTQVQYTPSVFDVWDLDGEAWYYFGDSWHQIDFAGSTFDPDKFEIVNGVVKLKAGGITNNEIAANAAIDLSKTTFPTNGAEGYFLYRLGNGLPIWQSYMSQTDIDTGNVTPKTIPAVVLKANLDNKQDKLPDITANEVFLYGDIANGARWTSIMTQTQIDTGVDSTGRIISPKLLKDNLNTKQDLLPAGTDGYNLAYDANGFTWRSPLTQGLIDDPSSTTNVGRTISALILKQNLDKKQNLLHTEGILYVNGASTATTETGKIDAPFKTLETLNEYIANNDVFGYEVQFAPGEYEGDLELTDKADITFMTNSTIGQYRVVLDGSLRINGSKRIGLNGFSFEQGDIADSKLIYMYNVAFKGDLEVSGTGGYHRYDYCFFNGLQVLGVNTVDTRSCQEEGLNDWWIDDDTSALLIIDGTGMIINHRAGYVYTDGFTLLGMNPSGYSIYSSASVTTPTNQLRLSSGSCLQATGVFGKISKSGDCPYYLGKFVFEDKLSLNTFNGIKLDGGLHSGLIYDHNTRAGYTQVDDTLKGHLDGIAIKLGRTGSGGTSGLANLVWYDPYSTFTEEDGSEQRPFKTMEAAIALANTKTYGTVVIPPASTIENLTLTKTIRFTTFPYSNYSGNWYTLNNITVDQGIYLYANGARLLSPITLSGDAGGIVLTDGSLGANLSMRKGYYLFERVEFRGWYVEFKVPNGSVSVNNKFIAYHCSNICFESDYVDFNIYGGSFRGTGTKQTPLVVGEITANTCWVMNSIISSGNFNVPVSKNGWSGNVCTIWNCLFDCKTLFTGSGWETSRAYFSFDAHTLFLESIYRSPDTTYLAGGGTFKTLPIVTKKVMDLSSQLNGSLQAFTLTETIKNYTLYYNGLRQTENKHYSISGTTLTITFDAPTTGEELLLEYF